MIDDSLPLEGGWDNRFGHVGGTPAVSFETPRQILKEEGENATTTCVRAVPALTMAAVRQAGRSLRAKDE